MEDYSVDYNGSFLFLVLMEIQIHIIELLSYLLMLFVVVIMDDIKTLLYIIILLLLFTCDLTG